MKIADALGKLLSFCKLLLFVQFSVDEPKADCEIEFEALKASLISLEVMKTTLHTCSAVIDH